MAYAKKQNVSFENPSQPGVVRIGTLKTDWQYWLATNSTEGAFTLGVATGTIPANVDVVADPSANHLWIPVPPDVTTIEIKPFGTDAANETFNLWVGYYPEASGCWVPNTLWEGLCTLHTMTGVSGAKPSDSDRFCDDLSRTQGSPFAVEQIDSRNGSRIMIDTQGASGSLQDNSQVGGGLGIDFDLVTAATANCLVRMY